MKMLVDARKVNKNKRSSVIIMKPIELYNMEPVKIEKEIGCLKGFHYNHLPEIDEELWGLKNDKIEIKYYKNHCFDGRRVWILASVWYEGKPVMIIQNAGREGDDHSKRFITDKETYIEMVNYIKTLILPVFSEKEDVYDKEEEIEGLDSFYGYSLNGHFDIW
jgi:hypothetical protein